MACCDPVEQVAPVGMAFWHHRVIKISRRVARHAEALHNGERGAVLLDGDRHDVLQAATDECVREKCARAFGRKAPAPIPWC